MNTIKSYALYTLLVIGVLSSCTKGDELQNQNTFKNYEVIEIDGCQYINWGVSYGYMNITHKGDCKNPKHTCN